MIKEYIKDYADDARCERDFLHEMKSCTQLINIYESKEDQGKLFMMQEYVDGVSLKSILKTRPIISIAYKKFIVG